MKLGSQADTAEAECGCTPPPGILVCWNRTPPTKTKQAWAMRVARAGYFERGGRPPARLPPVGVRHVNVGWPEGRTQRRRAGDAAAPALRETHLWRVLPAAIKRPETALIQRHVRPEKPATEVDEIHPIPRPRDHHRRRRREPRVVLRQRWDRDFERLVHAHALAHASNDDIRPIGRAHNDGLEIGHGSGLSTPTMALRSARDTRSQSPKSLRQSYPARAGDRIEHEVAVREEL